MQSLHPDLWRHADGRRAWHLQALLDIHPSGQEKQTQVAHLCGWRFSFSRRSGVIKSVSPLLFIIPGGTPPNAGGSPAQFDSPFAPLPFCPDRVAACNFSLPGAEDSCLIFRDPARQHRYASPNCIIVGLAENLLILPAPLSAGGGRTDSHTTVALVSRPEGS